jgi:hypothetical protein
MRIIDKDSRTETKGLTVLLTPLEAKEFKNKLDSILSDPHKYPDIQVSDAEKKHSIVISLPETERNKNDKLPKWTFSGPIYPRGE